MTPSNINLVGYDDSDLRDKDEIALGKQLNRWLTGSRYLSFAVRPNKVYEFGVVGVRCLVVRMTPSNINLVGYDDSDLRGIVILHNIFLV